MKKFSKLKGLLKKEEEPGAEEQNIKRKVLEEEGEIDRAALSKIVGRMKEKYIKEGVLKETEAEIPTEATRLKRMVDYGPEMRIRAKSKDLQLFENPFIRFFGKFYSKLQSPISSLSNVLYKRFGQKLEYDLLASGMRYTVDQYLALALSATIIISLIFLAILFLLIIIINLSILIAIITAIVVPIFILIITLIYPGNRATKLASQIEKELPFALRHMSIEIRAGIGIYKTMESVATADYGPLSEGMKWVLMNVEKGVPTEDALEQWAERTKSEAVKRVVSHLVRALRTGGNLSEVMITIAEDVAFEHKQKIADFAEKLNLISLFLMMVGVVFPVLLTVLTTIGSSPNIQKFLGAFSIFSPQLLVITYFIICPAMLLIFMYIIKSSDPG